MQYASRSMKSREVPSPKTPIIDIELKVEGESRHKLSLGSVLLDEL